MLTSFQLEYLINVVKVIVWIATVYLINAYNFGYAGPDPDVEVDQSEASEAEGNEAAKKSDEDKKKD